MPERPIVIPRQAGIYVRKAREEQGLTRDQLAQLANVSKRTLASLELGDSKGVRLDKLLSVLGALGLGLYIGEEPDRVAASKRVVTSGGVAPKINSINQSYNDLIRDLLCADGYGPDGALPIAGGERSLDGQD